jgi:hypothetical protein
MDTGWHFQDNRAKWVKAEREKRIAKQRTEGGEVASMRPVRKVIKRIIPKGR